MKTLILGSIDGYGWNEVQRWAESIRSTGYDDDVTLVIYRLPSSETATQELLTNLKRLNIAAVQMEMDYRGNAIDHRETGHATMIQRNRFFHYWWYLDQTQINCDWIISTDVKDVLFQRNPKEWLKHHQELTDNFDIIASSEGQKYLNEPWNANDQKNAFGPIIWECIMKEKTVKNAGFMTIRRSIAPSLFLNIFFCSRGQREAADQAAYNLLTSTVYRGRTFMTTHNMGWCAQCGTMIDPTKPELTKLTVEEIPKIENGVFKTQDGTPYVAVHQWDRV